MYPNVMGKWDNAGGNGDFGINSDSTSTFFSGDISSEDEFYDHSAIMRNKLETKEPTFLVSQEPVLNLLNGTHMYKVVDMVDICKVNITERQDTDREEGSSKRA